MRGTGEIPPRRRHLRRGRHLRRSQHARGLTGSAIADYAGGLFVAFPDLAVDILSTAPAGDGMMAAQRTMRGTNTGSLRGNPPTGSTIAMPGADFIAVEEAKVRSVKGYFDRSAFAEQPGLQVIVQPRSVGPFSFGYGVRAQSGKLTKPVPST